MNAFLSLLASTIAASALACAEPVDVDKAPFAPRFSLDLLKEIAATSTGNVCLSPWSAGAALSLVQKGASGTTRSCMDAVLGDPDRWREALAKTDLAITAADRIYIDNGFELNPAYRQSLPPESVERVDFRTQPQQACRSINNWAAQKTDGLIRDLLSPASITPDTRLAAVNAILFRGKWARPFAARRTQDAPFHLSSGQTVQVPMMRQTGSFRYVQADDCRAVALPYRKDGEPVRSLRAPEGNVFFILMLPEENASARDWLNKLSPERLAALRTQLGASEAQKQIDLSLPRFSLEPPTVNLSDSLSRLGMQVAFGNKADFSGITSAQEPLFLSGVYQKCLVRVHEAGTEAAAATAAVIARCALPRIEAEVRADRPFVWMIATLDPEDPVFFAGILEQP